MMHKYLKRISCSIVGARGYSGLETARLLLAHPNAELKNCFATQTFRLSDSLSTKGVEKVQCLGESEIMHNLTDVVFLATPAEVSLKLAPQILGAGKTVIDLSGAFRLKKNDYLKWYGFSHDQKELLKVASYGLVPWSGPSGAHEKLIANPGCFATAINMGLIPLLKDHLIDSKNLVIDAKSGTSGAGKKALENLLFTEVDGECLPYRVGKHQHYPEILEAIEQFSGQKMEAHMTTSLIPVRRGIMAGIYATLVKGKGLKDVKESFQKAYEAYPLVKLAHVSETPTLLPLKKVVGTGMTHISFDVVDQKLYVFCAIDNLLKGAASQAVENFNRLYDLPVEAGIDRLEAMV